MARGSRNYFVGLLAVLKALCLYYNRYRSKLPPDLPTEVLQLLALANAACAALELYDYTHAGGR